MNDEFAGDSSQWAFGTGFEDPLAGVDTTVPPGVDPAELAVYCLMLGDDALIMSQRLSEWCSRAPDLEEDIALANMALDLLGQARLLLARAAAADPGVVPALPEGSPVPAEDALAFFRDAEQFRNVRLAEVENGDFAHVVVRLLLFSVARLALLERLSTSPDQVLAAVAAKGVKEITYHRDWAGRWFLTLAQGTEESRRRLEAALEALWPYQAELVAPHTGFGVDPATLRDEVDVVLDQVFAVSGVERPGQAPLDGTGRELDGTGHAPLGGTGRDGAHTDALAPLLAEMQVVARAHPSGLW
ncbi:phenylacetate-CoA oxygenase subunit PaaC [Nonomuraea sp. RK-328]|nr:phenylacetate-CoA oxygenase subunit PaaC [Nonomuraea sp. RK-328]